MDKQTAGIAYKHAPKVYMIEWKQRAIGHILKEWHTDRPDDFESVVFNRHSGWLIDIRTTPTGTGQYGHHKYELSVAVDQEIVDQIDVTDNYLDLVAEFSSEVEDQMVVEMTTTQEQSQFSAKEFAALMLHQKDWIGEREASDALDIAVGTYRGKIGRIKEKIEAAKLTARLYPNSGLVNTDHSDDEITDGYADLVSLFEADEYPIETEDRGKIQSLMPYYVDEVSQYTDEPTVSRLVKHLVEKYEDEGLSTHRMRYEVERAIDTGKIERDGDIIRKSA